jgi:RNA polymerase sigma factor (sigma-70 family)
VCGVASCHANAWWSTQRFTQLFHCVAGPIVSVDSVECNRQSGAALLRTTDRIAAACCVRLCPNLLDGVPEARVPLPPVSATVSNLTHDLVLRYQRRLLAYCRQLTRDENQALDLSQQTWARVIEYRVNLDTTNHDAFRRLARIARNVFLSGLRHKRACALLTSENDPGVWNDDSVERTDLYNRVVTLAAEMDVAAFAILAMRMASPTPSWEQVAATVGVSVRTAKRRATQLRRNLRARMSRE